MASSIRTNWYQDLPEPAKRIVRALAILLMAGLCAGAFAFAYFYTISSWVASSTRYSPRQINVSGEGIVALRPDIAVLNLGIITQEKKVGDAQRENSAHSNALIAFLKSQGVADKDIKTVHYGITPQYQYPVLRPCTGAICQPQGPPTISSYEVRHTLEIKIRDLGKADMLLDGIVGAGANEVGQITFRVDDENEAKAEARAKAIAEAQAKASRIARDLGVRLARIISFSDSGEGGPVYPYALKADFDGASSVSSAPHVAPGEQEIRSSVTITYEFR